MSAVLITPESLRHQPGPFVDQLQQAGFEIRYPRDPLLARGRGREEDTIAELQGIAATIAGNEWYSERVLTGAGDLRVIARCGVGFDRVDVPAATGRGVAVTITPTANHESVAELVLALMLAAAKSIVVNDRRVRQGQWSRELLAPLRTRTLGILGLGRIGRSVAVRARPLGMTVVATEHAPDPEFVAREGIELVDFDTLLARSDFLSIHCPLNDETRGLFNAQVLARMKPGSTLINTARGKIVVEADLVAALRSGRLRAAGLDVFDVEPPATDNPLLTLDNVVLSPHLAGTDELSMERMVLEAAECIIKLARNEWPAGAVVNAELRSNWHW